MELQRIDLTIPENQEALYNFYQRNYEAPDYLLPTTFEGIYYTVTDGEHLLAVTKHHYPSPFLLKTSSTVVHKDMRGQGIGRFLNEEVEKMAKENGVLKLACHVYVDNLPSLILKLKRGYIIEGTLYNHDEPGKHEYILGKEL